MRGLGSRRGSGSRDCCLDRRSSCLWRWVDQAVTDLDIGVKQSPEAFKRTPYRHLGPILALLQITLSETDYLGLLCRSINALSTALLEHIGGRWDDLYIFIADVFDAPVQLDILPLISLFSGNGIAIV